jgi:endonuclease/exonuclease/phosphatase family metal-dependent hydrolase
MSFNVLTSNRGAADFDPSVPGADVLLENRAPVMAAWIRSAGPDVIGLQENEASSPDRLPLRALSPLLPGYTPVHGELGVPLLVRDDAYSVADSDALDISQGHYTRHLAWLRLISPATGRELLVANTHLDPYQRPEMAAARSAEVAAIVTALRRLSPDWRIPTLLLGDLNLRPDDPRPEYASPLARLARAGLLDAARIARTDASAVPGAASVNGLGTRIDGRFRYRAIRTDGFRYDYAFVSPGLGVRSWQVVTGPGVRRIGGHRYFADGPVPSDHCPVQAEVSIPAR